MKRCFDFITAAAGLVLSSPVLAMLAVLIRCTSGPPVFFRHVRIGCGGREFLLCKFRTMRMAPDSCGIWTSADGGWKAEGVGFDAGDMSRVTPVGRMLRRWKLDELPQLWNVLMGDMSLVGPRPEVRTWVDAYSERWARVLTVRPGITDPASIVYHNEEDILAQSPNPQRTYREDILPHKLSLYEDYVRNRTFLGDIKILLMTLRVVVGGGANTVRSREFGVRK